MKCSIHIFFKKINKPLSFYYRNKTDYLSALKKLLDPKYEYEVIHREKKLCVLLGE